MTFNLNWLPLALVILGILWALVMVVGACLPPHPDELKGKKRPEDELAETAKDIRDLLILLGLK